MDRHPDFDLLELKDAIIDNFTSENWDEVGILAGCDAIIDGRPRLLRSLSWHDGVGKTTVLDAVSLPSASGNPSDMLSAQGGISSVLTRESAQELSLQASMAVNGSAACRLAHVGNHLRHSVDWQQRGIPIRITQTTSSRYKFSKVTSARWSSAWSPCSTQPTRAIDRRTSVR